MKNIHQLLKPSFTINPSVLTTIEEEQNEMLGMIPDTLEERVIE